MKDRRYSELLKMAQEQEKALHPMHYGMLALTLVIGILRILAEGER